MPTAPKVVAAVLVAALAWYVSDLVKGLLPDSQPTPMLSQVNAIFGFLMGWRVLGSRAGDGFVAAIGYGMTAAFATLFWALLFWSGYEMTIRSIRKRYDGPVEALTNQAELAVEYGAYMLDGTVLISFLVGGAVVGLVTEWSSRKWS